ncbi:MAG: hypothetical protein JWN86_3014 [Planctomycetota bacterium]|nr:hypothetical protein [Planctomycetota bacterium]
MPRLPVLALVLLGLCLTRPSTVGAPSPRRATRPFHTYTIVARDPKTGGISVAVQSHWIAIGPLVPWAGAGVGTVATQSFVDPSCGKLGLCV